MDTEDRIGREIILRSAALRGDEQAWRAWYEESFDGLYAYVSWRCAGLGEPIDDAVQETWLIAFRQIRQFDPAKGSFAGWLRGIAANVLRKQRRTFARSGQAVDSLTVESLVDRSMETGQANRERAELIAAALAALPDHYEAALRAKYVDKQTVEQIATARNESLKAVESLLTRARAAFRSLIDECHDLKPPGESRERARNSQ